MVRKITIILFLFIMAIYLNGCRKNKITLDDREPLSLAPDVQWALIIEPYTAYKKEPTWESQTLEHCRKGDIEQILGRVEREDTIWYKFSNGYLPQEVLEVYQNKYKAMKQKDSLK